MTGRNLNTKPHLQKEDVTNSKAVASNDGDGASIASVDNSPTEPTIDLQEAARFLEALDPKADSFCFQVFGEGTDGGNIIPETIHGTLEELGSRLTRLNQDGSGIFVTINEVETGKARKKENIKGVRDVFADDDNPRSDGPRTDWPIPTSMVVKSSPGKYHYHWFCDRVGLTEFEGIQKAIAKTYDTDPSVNDLPRVLRLPGFLHQKTDPFKTSIVEGNASMNRYTREDILAAFPPIVSGPNSSAMGVASDPVLDALHHAGLTKSELELGKWSITCPWVDEHTYAQDSGTVYFQAHTGGRAHPGFKCQHAHCNDRALRQLREYLELKNVIEGGVDGIREALAHTDIKDLIQP